MNLSRIMEILFKENYFFTTNPKQPFFCRNLHKTQFTKLYRVFDLKIIIASHYKRQVRCHITSHSREEFKNNLAAK